MTTQQQTERERLADDLEKICAGEWVEGADAKFRRIAALLRGDEPAKPDRYMTTAYEVWNTYTNEGPAERLAERLRELLAKVNEPCPAPLPEQDSRVGEAMAARADDEARKAWRARVEDARGSLINAMPTLLARIAALEDALREIADMTQKKQLPLTSMVNDIATKALGKESE